MNTDTTVFSDRKRTDATPSGHNESTAVPTYWTHREPIEAVAPLPVWRVVEPLVDRIVYRENALRIHDLFELPDVWPAGEAFPREETA